MEDGAFEGLEGGVFEDCEEGLEGVLAGLAEVGDVLLVHFEAVAQ